jgi:hypothetical protein
MSCSSQLSFQNSVQGNQSLNMDTNFVNLSGPALSGTFAAQQGDPATLSALVGTMTPTDAFPNEGFGFPTMGNDLMRDTTFLVDGMGGEPSISTATREFTPARAHFHP